MTSETPDTPDHHDALIGIVVTAILLAVALTLAAGAYASTGAAANASEINESNTTEVRQWAENQTNDSETITPTPTASPTPTPSSTSTPTPSSTSTPTDTPRSVGPDPDEDPEQTDAENATEIEATLGDLDIHSVEWIDSSDEKAVILGVTWRGRTPTTMTSIQMIDPNSQAEDLAVDQTRLRPGTRTQVKVSMTKLDPIVVSTPESIENQRAKVFTHDPHEGEEVRIMWGVLLGIGVGGAGTVGAVYRRYRSTSSVERTTDTGGLL